MNLITGASKINVTVANSCAYFCKNLFILNMRTDVHRHPGTSCNDFEAARE